MADLPPSYDSIAEVTPSAPPGVSPVSPETYDVFSQEQVDLRGQIQTLSEVISGLSSNLIEDHEDQKRVYDVLDSKKSQLNSELESWRRQVIGQIDRQYFQLKDELRTAHSCELKRLKKVHDKVTSALDASETLIITGKRLTMTGNQIDLQILKENMNTNIQTLDRLLERRTSLKATYAEDWCYCKPIISTVKSALGRLTVHCESSAESQRFEDFLDGAVGEAGSAKAREANASMTSYRERTEDSDTTAASAGPIERSASEKSREENLVEELESVHLDERYLLLRSLNSKTYNDKARCHPVDFTLDPMGHVIVPDKNNEKVKIFTETGQLIKEFRHQYLKSPSGVTVTPEGNLAISDSGKMDIKVFNSDGELLFTYQGAMHPAGMVFNSRDELIVGDTGLRALLLYDARNPGKPIWTLQQVNFPPYGNQLLDETGTYNPIIMQCPQNVAVNSKDDIFISDRIANSVYMLDGKAVRLHGRSQALIKNFTDFKQPYGLTVDKKGNILVANSERNSVDVIESNDMYKKPILAGYGLQYPTCVKISPEGKIVVSEYMSGLIKIFGTQEIVDSIASQDTELPPAYPAYSGRYVMGSYVP